MNKNSLKKIIKLLFFWFYFIYKLQQKTIQKIPTPFLCSDQVFVLNYFHEFFTLFISTNWDTNFRSHRMAPSYLSRIKWTGLKRAQHRALRSLNPLPKFRLSARKISSRSKLTKAERWLDTYLIMVCRKSAKNNFLNFGTKS